MSTAQVTPNPYAEFQQPVSGANPYAEFQQPATESSAPKKGPLDTLASKADSALPYIPPFETKPTTAGGMAADYLLRPAANAGGSILKHLAHIPAGVADSVAGLTSLDSWTPQGSIKHMQERAVGGTPYDPDKPPPITPAIADEYATDKVGSAGAGLLAGKAAELGVRGLVKAGGAARAAAIGDTDAAASKGLRVPPLGKKVLPMQAAVDTARPYLQGVNSLEDLQARVPQAKGEIWSPYQKTIESVGQSPINGPDGMTTIADLENERMELNARNRKIKAGDPSEMQRIMQAGLNPADLIAREKHINSILDPELSRYGIDPTGIRKTYGSVAQIGKQVEGRSTLTEKPQPYGFGKMANISLEHPLQAPGKILSGARDLIAGRPLMSGSPTDIGIREGFSQAGPKPNLGAYKPINPVGLLNSPTIELGRSAETGATSQPPPFYHDTTPMRTGRLLNAPPIQLGGKVEPTPAPMFRHDTTPMRQGRTLTSGVSDDFPLSSHSDIFPNQLPEGTRIRPKLIEGKR